MNLDSALQTFFAEAADLLDVMEAALLRLDEDVEDRETLNELFRAVHTIKGSAGLFGLDDIVRFTHTVENLLDHARDGKITLSTDLLSILLPCRDHIVLLVDHARHNQTNDEQCLAQGQQLLASLAPWLGSSSSAQSSPTSAPVAAHSQYTPAAAGALSEKEAWHISVRLGRDLLRNGMDPLSIIRFLNTLGQVTHIATLADNLPPLEQYDPEDLYLGFEISLLSQASQQEIEDAFMFVRDDSDIKIIPPRSNVQAYINLIKSLPENIHRLGEILVKSHAITYRELEDALAAQKQQAIEQKPVPRIGTILVDNQVVAAEIVDAAVDKQKTINERKNSPENRFIRVDADRLDKLINLIGELVINRQRIDLLVSSLANPVLSEAVTTMGSFTEQIRDAALTLRMVPIGETFHKFKRVVRDTARSLGKEIDLVIEGADTELDRSMVEKLNDPLMHIVRNAMDHGIESVHVRRERNKPAAGTLKLTARHDAGNIVIGISDDGGGLDVERIRKKAFANGLIDDSMQLSQQELFQLIFHPGFSTAEQVTNLSGRGVGMDVVRRNIEALQGGIDIDSELGAGTQFTIRLPLTLAIIDGFHVAASAVDFIVPQNTILECVDLKSLNHIQGQHCVNLRGDQVPYIRLRDIFNLPTAEVEREKIVVVQFGDKRAGLVVDELHGEIQTVVKPMGPIFQALKGIGGSSLLGTGAVALILDIQQLIHFAIAKEQVRNNIAGGSLQEINK
ncbi:chemotaxis protein CheA [Cellvibrio japonicus]|uniref:Chemotaxis protein CheA n=1 Tax=Cellvibrio japonicus (strain Ueda107) TaxID=498211 RepID=B3PCN6_CELJU|nr:chemotaxis protein CheA [Cellvibrio japonicus]ACE83952.1 chemotaxis sensor histidine kinase CheA [Cellvibrio japonicus Ueda107]QEI13259.1 chemotaxis protein CheA [Cellvibrio japonicus]QEI16833.1 chemotaxis protein CheA [Cellvibrio japonicus]QEI20411.1 chemotaxis protein CheA [Cellvibrio japonicus]